MFDDEGLLLRVVLNHEEQYSLWFTDRDLPLGWTEEGFRGSKAECLAHIEKIWTDMRPLSLRKKMAESASETMG
jgi:MbtH protein